MKKYLSVLSLNVRSTIYKIFFVLIAMTLTQMVDYKIAFQSIVKKREKWNLSDTDRLLFTWNEVLEKCHTKWIFFAAVLMCSVVFIWSASERGKCKLKFSLYRLRISRRQVFAVFSGYHVLVYLILVALQILVVLWMHELYQAQVGMELVPQALFLSFYRDPFLHAILPLSDLIGMLRFIGFVLTWGIGTTFIGYKGFQKHRNACGIVMEIILIQALFLSVGIGSLGVNIWVNIVSILVSVITMLVILYSVYGRAEVDYEGC